MQESVRINNHKPPFTRVRANRCIQAEGGGIQPTTDNKTDTLSALASERLT